MTVNRNVWKRIGAFTLCLCLLMTLTGCSPESNYNKANQLLAEGKYTEAAEKFEALGSFEDAPMLTMYAKAAAAGESGQFEACIQAFETLGDFKDSPMMVTYYTARAHEAQGLAAQTPQQQATQESWVALLTAAQGYGEQLLFRDSQQRQQACYQAVYDMAEGMAAAELFSAARDAHNNLAYIPYLDSYDLGNYYAARHLEATAPQGILYEEQWVAEDFEKYQKAIGIYSDYPHVRDSLTRAEACRQAVYTFAMECAAHEDYTNACAIMSYASGHPDEDKLSAYWGACYLEQTGRYDLAAQRFEIYADFAPEGGDSGTVRAEAARQNGYNAAMALLEEGKYNDGYALLRSLGDYNDATNFIPQHEFQRAQAHLDAGEYEEAIKLLMEINSKVSGGLWPNVYTPELGEEAAVCLAKAYYGYGEVLFTAAQTDADYLQVQETFAAAGQYTPEGGIPAAQRYQSLWYDRGESLLDQEQPDYEGAREAFSKAGSYAPEGETPSAERISEAWYLEGEALLAQKEPNREGAKAAFEAAADYAPEGQPSGTERYCAMWYEDGEQLFAVATTDADYAKARDAFCMIPGYAPEGGIPADDRYAALWYERGEALLSQETPDYDGAYAAFLVAADNNYAPEGCADGNTRAKEAMHLKGEALLAQEAPNYHAVKTAFEAAGYSEATQKLSMICDLLGSTIDVSDTHTVGLCRDGTVVATGKNESGECNVTAWTDIIAVAAGKGFTVGLKQDGTVVAVGDNDKGQCDVESWTDIIAISAGAHYTVGLRKDGTIVATGGYYKGSDNVTTWTNIVAVAAGTNHTVGLKEDGTVVAVGYNSDGQCETSVWKNIVMIEADATQTIGLRQDGTVVAVGYGKHGQCETNSWSDIVAVDSGSFHTLGLKANGTVVAEGFNEGEQCCVSGFSDIVAVAGGGWTTIGLKADGTVVATGSNDFGQCEVAAWENIGLNTSYVEKILSEIK